jgi:hypothetical protein
MIYIQWYLIFIFADFSVPCPMAGNLIFSLGLGLWLRPLHWVSKPGYSLADADRVSQVPTNEKNKSDKYQTLSTS